MITRRHGEIDTVNYKNEYDEQNRLISRETLIGQNPLLKTVNTYDGNKLVRVENYQRTKFGTVHKYALIEYNTKDSISRKIVFSHGGDTLKVLSMIYNNENKLIKETSKDYEYKSITQREFSYTPNSKTEKQFRSSMNSKDTLDLKELKVTFNTNGDVIRKEEWELNASSMMIDDKLVSISNESYRNGIRGHVIVAEFEYQYDKFNNWIQFDYYFNGKQKKKNKTVSKRLITYY